MIVKVLSHEGYNNMGWFSRSEIDMIIINYGDNKFSIVKSLTGIGSWTVYTKNTIISKIFQIYKQYNLPLNDYWELFSEINNY